MKHDPNYLIIAYSEHKPVTLLLALERKLMLSKCEVQIVNICSSKAFWRSEYINIMLSIKAGLCSEPHRNTEEAFFPNPFRLFLEWLFFCSNFSQPLISLVCGAPSTHVCTMFRCFIFRAQYDIYKYTNIYIYNCLCKKEKAYSLCLVFWGNSKTGNILYDENPNEEKQDI